MCGRSENIEGTIKKVGLGNSGMKDEAERA